MQNTKIINNNFWENAIVSNDTVVIEGGGLDLDGKTDIPLFWEGIWYYGIWLNGVWAGRRCWLNGSWLGGQIYIHLAVNTGLISPKVYYRPKSTLSLNYAKYT